jgi:uncharacterized protein (TIGR02453 family)
VPVPDAPLTFAGFPPEAFSWFAGLEADNSRAWFAAHRTTYDGAVRGPLEAMLDELADALGGDVRVFRQQRDVRFSPDKSPYKTRTYGIIVPASGGEAARYAELSAAGLFAGTGYYELAADQLARFREAVAGEAAGPELEAAVAGVRSAGIETFGEALKTAPRGYPRDHPRIALLRHRSLVAGRRVAPGADGIPRDAALDHARSTWAACEPLMTWLDAHVGPSAIPPDERFGRGRGRG